jgi:SAM-dependent methyltransferase
MKRQPKLEACDPLTDDWKQRTIAQWTQTPCGPEADTILGLMAGRREYAPWMADALDYQGAAGLAVLDVGCGQGIDLCEYAAANARATGVDLTPRHVELAREHLAELRLDATVVEGDAERLPFSDETFDRVSSNGVLHHTPNMEVALREIRRVLRPGGHATFIVYNRSSWHFWLHQIARHGILRGQLIRTRSVAALLSENIEAGTGRPLVRVYTRHRLRAVMCAAGFAHVRVDVSPMRPDDTLLRRRLPGGGWYLIGRGSKD